jgi:20S proteasome subunit beta 4
MEALIGIVGGDYVILAADRRAARSIVVMKSTDNKFRDLGKTVSLAYSGEPGDAVNFAEYVQGNVKLYEMRNELSLSTHAAAHYTRRLLADSLRTRVILPSNIDLSSPPIQRMYL